MHVHKATLLLLTPLFIALCGGCAHDRSTQANEAGNVRADTRPQHFGEVGISGPWLTVDGERFLVVAAGYEIGVRPGRVPWDHDHRPNLLHHDFARIRAAGFNTIRTWAPLSDEELELAASYGLWVIQGIWYKPDADFSDTEFQVETIANIRKHVARSSKHPNILFYLLGNEPHGHSVHETGIDEVKDFYAQVVVAAREEHPEGLFSYSNCVITDFVDPDEWDLLAANVYPYSPGTIEKALGYRTYLETLIAHSSAGMPTIITEYGLSVSPSGDGRGYGGNTLEEQRDGVIRLTDDLYNAGAAGHCSFMWIDGWWKSKDENAHDDHAEEWYGFFSVDRDQLGQPRPVYYALQDYNRAIRIQPKATHQYAKEVPLEVWSESAKQVQYRVDEGPWIDLPKDGAWWRTTLPAQSLGLGQHYVWTRALDQHGEPGGLNAANIEVTSNQEGLWTPLNIELVNVPDTITTGETVDVTVRITRDGQGVPSKKFRIDRFVHTGWFEDGADLETDENGEATWKVHPLRQPGIMSVAVGTVAQDGLFRRRIGAYTHIHVAQ